MVKKYWLLHVRVFIISTLDFAVFTLGGGAGGFAEALGSQL